jgi:superfamily II DNA or RNA helicase
MTKREKEQKVAFEKWKEHKCFGTVEGATGFGKTRIGVMAAAYYAKKYNYNFSILIVVPDTNLRDNEWKKEFIKWGEEEVWNKCVEIQCIQTVYKWKDRKWDLVIADEIHDMIPPIDKTDYKYGRFFYNNRYRGLLGLSGSIGEKQKKMLKYIAPVVYSLHTEEAKEKAFVSDFIIYCVGVNLTEGERQEYDKLTSQIERRKKWNLITQRVEILYKSKNKQKVAKNLAKKLKGRGVIFNMRNEIGSQLSKVIKDSVEYHSGIPKKQREVNLEEFRKGNFRVLVTTKAINQGANLPKMKWGIIVAGTSKEKDTIQRLGRIIRKEGDNKKAILVRLYCKDTVEELHLRSSLNKFKSVKYATYEEFIKLLKNDSL